MSDQHRIYETTLSDTEFRRLSEFISNYTGIKMPREKKIMLEGRLRKRLRKLSMNSFSQYIEYLFSDQGMETELLNMIDVVTTNKTDFFREPGHFDFMIQNALPQLIATMGSGIGEKLMIWSAGSSTGEEAYSIAMTIEEFGEKYPGFKLSYRILATDICTEVLETGHRGIYSEDKAENIPLVLRKKFLLRSKDPRRREIRILPKLREHVKFRRLNFLDEDFGFREHMDIIFCRNVIIYFDKPTQKKILKKLTDYLKPGGFLFIGHSETLLEMDLPLQLIAPTIYRRIG